jgi:hypothetical protein
MIIELGSVSEATQASHISGHPDEVIYVFDV